MESSANRKWLTESLRESLESLAAPGDVALSRLPEQCVRSDELALDFDNFNSAYVGSFSAELSVAQREALSRVDQLFGHMSDKGNSHLWTDEAVRSHPAWAEIRKAAAAALDALGWAER
jgi:hypothetical protein